MQTTTCPLCQPLASDQLIWRGGHLSVIFAGEADFPGFVRVIWNGHVSEMTELSSSERDELMRIVFKVEDTVRRIMQPKKINLAALGNMVPHIHWHIIPRYEDDATFPGSVWSERLRATPSEVLATRRSQENRLRQELINVLN